MKKFVAIALGLALCAGCATSNPKPKGLNYQDVAKTARDLANGYLEKNPQTSGWWSSVKSFLGMGTAPAAPAVLTITQTTNETYAVNTGASNVTGRIALENLAVISDTRTVVTTFPYRPVDATSPVPPQAPITIVLPPQGGPVVSPPSAGVPPTASGGLDVGSPIVNTNLGPIDLGDLLKGKR